MMIRHIDHKTITVPAKTYSFFRDGIGRWLVACCIQDDGLQTTMQDLYSSYCSYCTNARILPYGITGFGRELTRLQFLACKIGYDRARYGIGLKENPQIQPPTPPKHQPVWYGTSSDLLNMIHRLDNSDECLDCPPEVIRILKEVAEEYE